MKVKCDHRSKFSNLSNWKGEAWKKSGLQRDSNPWPPRIPVRCSTNWAMKPHIGSKVNLLSSYLPVQWNHVKYIWNNSYLYCGSRWKWSVIIAVNFPIKATGKEKPEKNQGFNGIRTHDLREYRCDALPTELWSHTLGARSIYWVHIFPCSEIMWNIYEIIHICTAAVDESEVWSSQ